MKKRLPAIITVLLIASALLFLTGRERWSNMKFGETAPASPEDVIWRMVDAARDGDARAYLDCFGGALRERLEKTANEMGASEFSRYLKKLNGEMTGIAVSDFEQSDEQTARLRVEFVSRGKSEAQTHRFRLIDGEWKIEAMEDAERINALIPYGAAEKQ